MQMHRARSMADSCVEVWKINARGGPDWSRRVGPVHAGLGSWLLKSGDDDSTGVRVAWCRRAMTKHRAPGSIRWGLMETDLCYKYCAVAKEFEVDGVDVVPNG